MKNQFKTIAVILIIELLFFFTAAKGQNNLLQPTSSKYINDYANIINEDAKGYVISVGKELEDKTTAQAVVIIIKSLEGKDIDSYANQVFRQWGIGQKNKDNGLLILLSVNDRKWRVEVGRGLEGAVTDIESSRIMTELGTPLFKENKYSEGIKNVYSAFSDKIANEYNVKLEKNMSPSEIAENSKGTSDKVNIVYIIILLGFIFFDGIFNRGRVTKFMLSILFIRSFGRGYRGWGGGGYGGFGDKDGPGGGMGGFGGGSSGGW